MDDIREKLTNLHLELGSWPKVAREFDISPAMAWRIANEDYEPKDPEIRKRLGYPEIIEIRQYRDPETGLFTKEK